MKRSGILLRDDRLSGEQLLESRVRLHDSVSADLDLGVAPLVGNLILDASGSDERLVDHCLDQVVHAVLSLTGTVRGQLVGADRHGGHFDDVTLETRTATTFTALAGISSDGQVFSDLLRGLLEQCVENVAAHAIFPVGGANGERHGVQSAVFSDGNADDRLVVLADGVVFESEFGLRCGTLDLDLSAVKRDGDVTITPTDDHACVTFSREDGRAVEALERTVIGTNGESMRIFGKLVAGQGSINDSQFLFEALREGPVGHVDVVSVVGTRFQPSTIALRQVHIDLGVLHGQ